MLPFDEDSDVYLQPQAKLIFQCNWYGLTMEKGNKQFL